MKLLVCGAGGMLGQDVVRAAELAGHAVTALDQAELDLTYGPAVERSLARLRPGAVINCAAFTDVDGAEDAPERAMAINAWGARNLALAAAQNDAVLVHLSTDYVFDGSAGRPYVESDEPAPLSSYGRSKLAGEREVAAANHRHHIVRSSWLFGVGGRNFVDTMLELAARQNEVTVVDDQVASPTYTGHLAQGLLDVLGTEAYGLRHVAAAGECSWYDFAVEIFRQAGAECRVARCSTEEMARPAPRPARSTLETERAPAIRLPDWKAGLEAYLKERQA